MNTYETSRHDFVYIGTTLRDFETTKLKYNFQKKHCFDKFMEELKFSNVNSAPNKPNFNKSLLLFVTVVIFCSSWNSPQQHWDIPSTYIRKNSNVNCTTYWILEHCGQKDEPGKWLDLGKKINNTITRQSLNACYYICDMIK